jgi:Transposase, Mutator family
MATPSIDITSFVGKLLEQDDVDALREGVRVLAQIVMDTEVSAQIGAGHYERSLERTAYRNGYRTRAGTREPARSSSRSRSSPPVPTSPRCWSRVGGRRRHCTRSSWRPT